MKRNQKLLGCVAACIFAASLAVIYFTSGKSGQANPYLGPYYYTDDDGASFFASTKQFLPPFDHNGKEAVGAVIFSNSNHQPFVGYLTKLTPEGQDALKSMDWKLMMTDLPRYSLVKRAGEKEWVPALSPHGRYISDKVVDPKTGQLAAAYEPSK